MSTSDAGVTNAYRGRCALERAIEATLVAAEFGCSVVVVDLTESYVRPGARLTARLGLGECVAHRVGDALALDPDGQTFAVIWTENSGMNIAAGVSADVGARRRRALPACLRTASPGS